MRESRWMRSSTRRRKSNFVASERERERARKREREREPAGLAEFRVSAATTWIRAWKSPSPRDVDVDVGVGSGGSLHSSSTSPPPASRRSSIRGAPPRPRTFQWRHWSHGTPTRLANPSPLALSPRLTNKFPSTSPRTTFYVSFSLGKYLGVEWIIIRITKRIIIVRSKLRWNSVRASFIYFENISLDLR